MAKDCPFLEVSSSGVEEEEEEIELSLGLSIGGNFRNSSKSNPEERKSPNFSSEKINSEYANVDADLGLESQRLQSRVRDRQRRENEANAAGRIRKTDKNIYVPLGNGFAYPCVMPYSAPNSGSVGNEEEKNFQQSFRPYQGSPNPNPGQNLMVVLIRSVIVGRRVATGGWCRTGLRRAVPLVFRTIGAAPGKGVGLFVKDACKFMEVRLRTPHLGYHVHCILTSCIHGYVISIQTVQNHHCSRSSDGCNFKIDLIHGGSSSDSGSHSSHYRPEQSLLIKESEQLTRSSSTKFSQQTRSEIQPELIKNPISPRNPSPNPSKAASSVDLTPNHNTPSFSQMPCVSTTGNSPNGKTIHGFLYRYTPTEVCILCICHGTSFSPAEFVEHAGGKNISHPLRHITVVPSMF
ncbi:RNA-binding (RRM-RBD-RNP motif) domain nuclear transport factor 2 family protein [Actinidia rufa]|uniref:Ninja-family protein n=1 Tax=Actinidia rufa TaxID=165716 RepID=A0A7J0HAW4_9ERIC|nr:RNA-binding (RRM-RBD-RNP motif) domain nuclear transport factor 2 family protein [Actinidia rufa]